MSDANLEDVRKTLSHLPADKKMPGLTLGSLNFDFYTASYRATFQWEGKSATLVLSKEKAAEVQAGGSFVVRRLRNDIRSAFNIEAEGD